MKEEKVFRSSALRYPRVIERSIPEGAFIKVRLLEIFFARRFFVKLTFIAIMLPASASAQEATAVITNIDGEVFYKAAMDSSWQVARTKTPLGEGDSVKTGKRARATILYKNSLQKKLPGGKKYVVLSPPPSSRSNSWLANLWAALTSEKEDLTLMGASRGDNLLRLYPRFRKALSARPTFTWLPVVSGATHHVQIVDENSWEIIWETSTVDTFVTYPPEAPALADSQEYTIQLLRAGESDPDDEMTFTAASIEERETILFQQKRIEKQYRPRAAADLTLNLLLAHFFLQNEFHAEAFQQIHQALTKQPHNRAMKLVLLDLYRDVGPFSLIDPLIKELKR